MAKFRVYLVTEATTVVEVEAEDGEGAIEKAYKTRLPYAPAFADYEFSGEWMTPSEMYPGNAKPEDDYQEVSE